MFMPCNTMAARGRRSHAAADYANLRPLSVVVRRASLRRGLRSSPLSLADIIQRWNLQSPEALATRASETLPYWFSLLLVIVLGYYAARLVWLLVPGPAPVAWSPPPPSGMASVAASSGSATAAAIANAHLFGQPQAAPEPDDIGIDDAPETQLNLQLRGVVAAADERFAHAIIADASGLEKVYFLKDTIPGGATLRGIQADRVVLARGGAIEVLILPREPGTGPQAAARRMPASSALARVPTQTMQDVVTQNASGFTDIIRPQPFMPNGELKGYRIYPGRNRDQFVALGLQPGDLVTEINGMTLNNPAQAMELFRSLADTTQVTVMIERDGQPQSITLDTTQVAAASGATQ